MNYKTPPTDTELAWAAGILDGEGSIFLVRRKGKVHHNWHYQLIVQVTNTELPILVEYKRIFDVGHIVLQREAGKDRGTRPCWQWKACCGQAEYVLALVEQFLIGKKEQAKLALLSRQYMNRGGRRKNDNLQKLEWLKLQLSQLKEPKAKPEAWTETKLENQLSWFEELTK